MAGEDDRADRLRLEAGRKRVGLLSELWSFVATERRWWLLPIVLAFVVLGVLVLLSSSPAAPFIYPLF